MRHLATCALALATALVVAVPATTQASHDGELAEACPAGTVPEDGFADIDGGSTHEASIDCLVWWEVTGGRTWAEFDPGLVVPRDQMASFVARLMEAGGAALPAAPADHFDDDDTSPHEVRINQLAELGVIDGTGEREFSPTEHVNRAQTAALLVRAWERTTGRELPAGPDAFSDDEDSTHEPDIDAAAAAGWAKGVGDGRFAPRRSLTRDEMATFLVRVLDTFVEDGDASRPASFATGPPPALDVELVTDQAVDPIFVTAPPGDDRLFVVERAGRVRVLDGGQMSTYLDIRSEVSSGGERGLFAIAFPPGWPEDGRVFASWTDVKGDSVLASFTATAANADPSARTVIDEVAQPASNHNGGMITFGPDGLLWWGLGDGGGSGDPNENGQDGSTPLGGLNRYDVSGAVGSRPPGNIFAEPSLWAIGLRNPWRFAFDPVTDHLYVADVGQSALEEVDIVPARRRGLNFGWDVLEGSQCHEPASGCDRTGKTPPEYEYGHGTGGGCSITGGVVYRGTAIPALRGHYLFGDLCSGWVRSLRYDGATVQDVTQHDAIGAGITGSLVSFGTDAAGEAYVITFDGIWRIVPAG